MDPGALGKGIERWLRCTETVVQEHASGAVSANHGELIAMLQLVEKTGNLVLKDMNRPVPGSKRASCSKAWLEAYLKVHAFKKMETLLAAVREQAAVAMSTSNSSEARRSACVVVVYAGETALSLLSSASQLSGDLLVRKSTPSPKTYTNAIEAMTTTSFLLAAAGAVRGLTATAAMLRSETTVQELAGGPYDIAAIATRCNERVGHAAVSACKYLLAVADAMFFRLGAMTTVSAVPPSIAQPLDGLIASQLLAVAASAVVDSPPVDQFASTDSMRSRSRFEVASACMDATKAMFHLHKVQRRMDQVGGPEGLRLSAGMLAVAQHEAVQRLRIALLDQMAAHAGMGAKLGDWMGEQGWQAGSDGEGWTGSSGTWWLAREEAAQGQLLGLDAYGGDGRRDNGYDYTRGNTAGWLEDGHCNILHTTMLEWLAAPHAQAAAAAAAAAGPGAGPAVPPPLLRARLTARAAEALVRLGRGQGLDGAYAPAPEWQFAMSQKLVLVLLVPDEWASLPVATARACAPYWLEAAGWLVALLSDATAAAMGRLPATKRSTAVYRSTLDVVGVKKGLQAETLRRLMDIMAHVACSGTHGFKKLPAAAQADVRRRMSRCGLAASLDHTLRLTYSAQDAGDQAKADIAMELRDAVLVGPELMDVGLVAFMPPTGGSGAGGGGAGGGGAGGSGAGGSGAGCSGAQGDSGADGGDGGEAGAGAGHQLGIVYTLSKRAAMLTRALEAVSATAGAAGAGQAQAQGEGQGLDRTQVVGWAIDALTLLKGAAGGLEGDVRERVAAAWREAGEGSSAAWREEAVCVEVVQEALALAARCASRLAALLAWELAGDVAAAAREAAALGRSAQLTFPQQIGLQAVSGVLGCTLQWWRHPLLPPAQLMACQPHRLLAAACTLAAALPETWTLGKREHLCVRVPSVLAAMAAHKTLSGQVRGWLAPPPAAAAASGRGGTGNGGNTADAYAGCLAAPVRSLVRHILVPKPMCSAHALALLSIAAGEGQDGGRATGEADGGFQRFAAAVADAVSERVQDADPFGSYHVPMPDGSSPMLCVMAARDGAGNLPRPLPPVAPSGALPPPMALPPCRQGALPRLRVCGNPHCGNFAEEGEGWLPLKQCGGCRAVRYCCADCQRGHWRAGHKAECKLMGAEAGS